MEQETENPANENALADAEVSDRILTVPNVISTVRLLMAPVALYLLIAGYDIAATALFATSAATDFVDGQIARRTHTVSRLGQLLDPAVDRVLMICAVLGLMIVGRLPIWIVVVVLVRDGLLLVGGAWLLKNHNIRVAVIYPGKFATTFLFVGLAGLMLNIPQLPGLGMVPFDWLPGFNAASCSWGIWSIYIGLFLGLFTTIYYIHNGISQLKSATGK